MSRNGCKSTRLRLPLLAGGELLGNDRREVERHVIGCNDCRHHLDSLRNALQVLHVAAESVPVRPDVPSLWPALSRQIRESRRPIPPSWASRFAWPIAGMAATLALAIGTLVVSRPSQQRHPVPQVVQRTPAVIQTTPYVVQNERPAEPSEESTDPDPARHDSSNRSRPANRAVSDPSETQLTH